MNCQTVWCYNFISIHAPSRRIYCTNKCYSLYSNYKRNLKTQHPHKWDRYKQRKTNIKYCEGYKVFPNECKKVIEWWELGTSKYCRWCRKNDHLVRRKLKILKDKPKFIRGVTTYNCCICKSIFYPHTTKVFTCSTDCSKQRDLDMQQVRRHRNLHNKSKCRCFDKNAGHLYRLTSINYKRPIMKIGIASDYSRIERHLNKSIHYPHKIQWKLEEVIHFDTKQQARNIEKEILNWKDETGISYNNVRHVEMHQYGRTELIDMSKTRHRSLSVLIRLAHKHKVGQ